MNPGDHKDKPVSERHGALVGQRREWEADEVCRSL